LKFLVDRCAGQRLADWLREQGHDVLASREVGEDPGDEALLRRAATEGRVLVTIDKDFGKFLYLKGEGHQGLVRLPDVLVEVRIRLMEQILKDHGTDLAHGAIVTVRGDRIRISRRLKAL